MAQEKPFISALSRVGQEMTPDPELRPQQFVKTSDPVCADCFSQILQVDDFLRLIRCDPLPVYVEERCEFPRRGVTLLFQRRDQSIQSSRDILYNNVVRIRR